MKLTTKALKLAGAAVATIGLSSLATTVSAAPVSVTTKPNGAIQIVARPGSTITTNNKGVIRVAANHTITRIATNNHGVTTVTVRKIEPVNHFRYGYDDRKYDYRHKPPSRFEHLYRPHFARFFHKGHWDFKFGHWVWIGGYWMR